jgi:hypothetical protein
MDRAVVEQPAVTGARRAVPWNGRLFLQSQYDYGVPAWHTQLQDSYERFKHEFLTP